MGSAFLPTAGLLRDIAQALGREPNDPVVAAAFDQLVLRGQLWELPSELERVIAHLRPTP